MSDLRHAPFRTAESTDRAHADRVGACGAGVEGGAEIAIDALRVLGPAAAEIDVTLPRNLLPGAVTRAIVLTTAWEVARAPFTVLPAPRVVLAPVQIEQGASATITAAGQFTSFAGGATVVTMPPDAGLAVTGFAVESATAAALEVTADFAAAPGPRTLTFTTGGEVVEGTLAIVAGPPAVRIAPAGARQGEDVVIAVEGRNMAFGPATAAAWLPAGTEVQTLSVDVVDADHATVTARVAPTAAVGTVSLQLVTATASAQAPFAMLPAIATAAVTVSPAQLRQGETTHVVVTGTGTHFDGRTQLALPAGLSAANLAPVSTTRLEVDLVVAETAPLGPAALTATTGGESAPGALEVVAGLPRLTLTPAGVRQGAGPTTVTALPHFFALTAGMSFTIDPACDAALQSQAITSSTQAQLVINVGPLARPGPCAITVAAAAASGTLDIQPGPRVAIGADGRGAITPTARTAWFGVDAPAGALIYARAKRDLTSLLDPYLTLTDADRHTTLATNDNESRGTVNALILYRIPADGTYYFGVRDVYNATTAGVTLEVRRWSPETLSETEPNDTESVAQEIDLAATPSVLVRGDLVGSDTVDVYRLRVPAGYHFAADVIAREASPYPGSAADVELTLHVPDGPPIVNPDRGFGADPVIYYTPAADADLVLEVARSAADARGGFYLLNLRPAVVINEISAPSGGDMHGAFVEVVGPPALPLAGYSVVVGGFSHDFTGCNCALGYTGLEVLGHDVTAIAAQVIDAGLALPAGGTVELWRGGVRVDGFTYPAASGAYRFGRGFRIDTDAAGDAITQVEDSANEANYSMVP
ncbi:MAG TPA: hypothetical protein VGQ83_16660 [Polyangia bacterium]